MAVLLAFAFIGGVVTILSPCILPILPVILSSSVSGSKKRPLGIVTGFILSFTFFTLFLTAIVNAFGIPADTLRTISVVIIFFFGLSLLIPQTKILLEKLFSKFASAGPRPQKPGEQGGGFLSGIVIGLSLGLIWTPCVGPILASVISLALTGSVTGTAFFITLAYALGTAIPMLAILYGGRGLLHRVPWLLRNTDKIQKVFGVLMILTAIAIHFNYDRKFQSYILEKFPQYGAGLTQIEENDAVKNALDELNMGSDTKSESENEVAPEIIPGGEWFNSEALTLEELRGKVVLVDFWTYSCINCIRTLPYLRDWHDKYADDGLVILGVHSPEFEFEKSAENLQQAINDYELEYPIVQDNNFETWRAYNNRYWPAKYLVDKNGRIVYTHFGEGEYAETEERIRELLAEAGANLSGTEINDQEYELSARTPELYLGYGRIEYFASPEEIAEDQEKEYSFPDSLGADHFAYRGLWEIGAERAMAKPGSSLRLNYRGSDVFLVMRPLSENSQVTVKLDGEEIAGEISGADVKEGVITPDKDRLYEIINSDSSENHTLELNFPDGKVEVFAFTFG